MKKIPESILRRVAAIAEALDKVASTEEARSKSSLALDRVMRERARLQKIV